MEEFEVSSIVRGYHIYKETWTPFLTEHLECKREEGNYKDRYAVAVLRHDSVVGHIARRISAACTLFIQKNGSIKCTITGKRHYSADLPQGGLRYPTYLPSEVTRGDESQEVAWDEVSISDVGQVLREAQQTLHCCNIAWR